MTRKSRKSERKRLSSCVLPAPKRNKISRSAPSAPIKHLFWQETHIPRLKSPAKPDKINTTPNYLGNVGYVTCNDRMEAWSSGKPSETDPKSFGPTGPALCLEKDSEDGRAAHKSEFLEKLSPARVYHLCSPNMRMYLDARLEGRSIRALHFHDFVAAACSRLPELGISQSAWNAAVDAMGQDGATMCVVITDANTQNPNVPVLNPGGYLRGMTRAQQQGKLNIVGGLIGLTERRKQEK